MGFLSKLLSKKGGKAGGGRAATNQKHSRWIPDNFHSVEHVIEALRLEGLESSSLIVAVDFTKVSMGMCVMRVC